MSYLLSSIFSMSKAQKKQGTPIKPHYNNCKASMQFNSPLKTELPSTQLTLTQSTNYNKKHPIEIHKRNISFFSPNPSIKLTKMIHRPVNTPQISMPKISLSESDQSEMLSFYINGIAKTKLYPSLPPKSKMTQLSRSSNNTNRSKRLAQTKSRNKDKEEIFEVETNEQLFDRYNKGTYSELKKYITNLHKKNRTDILNESNRLYSSDFKFANKSRNTNDLRIVDHADFDYESLNNIREENYAQEIKCYNKLFYTTQAKRKSIMDGLASSATKTATTTTMIIEDTIIQLKQKIREDIYAQWKRVIVKAADQFRRCHLSLSDLYQGKYLMKTPFQEEYSEAFFKAVKFENTNRIDKLLKKNIYLVYSYDYFYQTAMHWAAKRNQYSLIHQLISKGANYNAQDKYGRTPLHLAAYYNCYQSVLVLLYHISSPFILDKGGQTPVQLSKDYHVIHSFKRATLLHLIHSMGKRAVFEDNYQRGFLWYIENELRMPKLIPSKDPIANSQYIE